MTDLGFAKKTLAAGLSGLILLLSPGVNNLALAASAAASNAGTPVSPRVIAASLPAPASPKAGAAEILTSMGSFDVKPAQAMQAVTDILGGQAAGRMPSSAPYALSALISAAESLRARLDAALQRVGTGLEPGQAAETLADIRLSERYPWLLSEGQRQALPAAARTAREAAAKATSDKASVIVAAGTSGWTSKPAQDLPQAGAAAGAPRLEKPVHASDERASARVPDASRTVSSAKAAGPSPSRLTPLRAASLVSLGVLGAVVLAHVSLPLVVLSAGLLGSILLHETAHLWGLRHWGDDTAQKHGHASLNPLRHVDPWGSLAVPLVSLIASYSLFGFPLLFGWAKPVDADFNKLKDRRKDPAKVAFMGPAVNLALAVLAFAAWFAFPIGGAAAFVLLNLAKINAALFVFNMLPLPNLDGGKILVRFLPNWAYSRWVANPRLPGAYQGVMKRLYEGPSNLLSRLGIDDQGRVNWITRLASLIGLGVFYAAGFTWLGAPLFLMVLACSYDYYCIREKIQNEEAVKSLMGLLQGFASAMAKAAEDDASIQSVVNTEEVEHVLKNALEDTIDRVMDSEGFESLSNEEKWKRFESAYLDSATEALSQKGMSADSPETIRRFLTQQGLRGYWDQLRSWIETHEVWAKWRSPKRKEALSDAVKAKDKPKEQSAGASGAAVATVAVGLLASALLGAPVMMGTVRDASKPTGPRTFEESLDDPNLKLSEKEKGFLLLHLAEMKLEKKPPVFGRVKEVGQVLSRVDAPRGVPSSVTLIGKAGVGKTGVLERLAQLLAWSDSHGPGPEGLSLKGMDGRFLLRLNVSRLLISPDPAAALDSLLQILQRYNQAYPGRSNKIVLFLDETHKLFEHSRGEQLVSLLLEPLRDGQITFVFGTTDDKWRQHFDKDEALKRRAPPIIVEEPSPEETLRYLQGARDYYEGLYGARLDASALKSAAYDSEYDQELNNPDRAFQYLLRALNNSSFDSQRDRLGLLIHDRLADLRYASQRLAEELAKKDLVTEALKNDEPTAIELYNRALESVEELLRLYQDRATVPLTGTPVVTDQHVKREIALNTGIASGQLDLGRESPEKFLRMEEELDKVVVGQPEAIHAVAEAIRAEKAGLKEADQPTGVFYMTGPTGSGKTYFAKKLAEYLFGSEEAMIRLDMTEYMHDHEVSKMIGSPPGYVGYEAGGQLTERVRKRPYSVVLFDEIEKANPAAWLILLQVLSEGRLTDGHGRTVSFKNCIVLMSSNLGMMAVDLSAYEKDYKLLKDQLRQADSRGDAAMRQAVELKIGELAQRMAAESKSSIEKITAEAFKQTYPPEFEGRIHGVLAFNRLKPEDALKIVALELGKLGRTLSRAGHELAWTDAAVKLLMEEGFDVRLGARPLNNAIRRLVSQPLAGEILKAMAEGGGRLGPSRIQLDASQGRIAISVKPLPPKPVARREAGAGAASEVFTRVLESALQAASRDAKAAPSAETLDSWFQEALGTAKPVQTATGSPAFEAQAPQPFFNPEAPLTLGEAVSSHKAAHYESERKDASVLAARQALAAALEKAGYPESAREALLRTVEDARDPYLGWLKLFVEQAKKMTPAEQRGEPVEIDFEVGSEASRVVVHRPGALGDPERALLATHFNGPALSPEKARDKAEALNVMGRDGRRLFFDLRRTLDRLPGARLGLASGERARGGSGVDYWIELPKPPKPPEPLPTPSEAAPLTVEQLGKIQSFLPDGPIPIDASPIRIDFDPSIGGLEEAIKPLLARLGLRYDSHTALPAGGLRVLAYAASGLDRDTEAALAVALAREPLIKDVAVAPRAMTRARELVWATWPARPQGSSSHAANAEVLGPERQLPAANAVPEGAAPPSLTFEQTQNRPDLTGAAQSPTNLNAYGQRDTHLRQAQALLSTALERAGASPQLRDAAHVALRRMTDFMKTRARSQLPGDDDQVFLHWKVLDGRAILLARNTGRAFHPDEVAEARDLLAAYGTARDELARAGARGFYGSNSLSHSGHGASIWLEIPLARPDPPEDPAPSGRTAAAQAATTRPSDLQMERLDLDENNDDDPGFQRARRAILAGLTLGTERPGERDALDEFLDRAVFHTRALARRGEPETVDLLWKVDGSRVWIELVRSVPSGGAPSAVDWIYRIRENQALLDRLGAFGAHLFTESAHDRLALQFFYARPGQPKPEAVQIVTPPPPAATSADPAQAARDSLRRFLYGLLAQQDQRGPTVRDAAAQALAAASSAEDLAKARDWIRFEDVDERHAELAAAALILARHGSRADDADSLARALARLDQASGHEANPAKRLVAEALAKLLASDDTARLLRLLERSAEPEDEEPPSRRRGSRSTSAPARRRLPAHWRNESVREAVYLALAARAGPEAKERLLQDWLPSRVQALFDYLKRADENHLRGLYADWREDEAMPDGADRLLVLFAIAEYGTREDLPKLLDIAGTAWDGELDRDRQDLAGMALGRLVARLGALPEIRDELAFWLRESLGDGDSFPHLMTAVQVLGLAGGAGDLALLNRVMEENPESINFIHELTQHEAAWAWARIAVRAGLMPRYLTQNEPSPVGTTNLPRIMNMLADAHPIVNKAALAALTLFLREGGDIPAASPLQGGTAEAQAPALPPHPFLAEGEPPLGSGRGSTLYAPAQGEMPDWPEDVGQRLERDDLGELAMEWVSVAFLALQRLTGLPFEHQRKVVRHPDGSATVAYVLRSAASSAIPVALVERLRAFTLNLLDLNRQRRDERELRLSRLEMNYEGGRDAFQVLRRLSRLRGAQMGIDHAPARRHEPQRGELELWLKLELPAPSVEDEEEDPLAPEEAADEDGDPLYPFDDDPLLGA